jgi:hypothetical protein
LAAAAGDEPKTRKTVDYLRDQPDTAALIEHVEGMTDRRKYFTAVFKSGSFRMVRVSDDDPTRFEMVLTREEGIFAGAEK